MKRTMGLFVVAAVIAAFLLSTAVRADQKAKEDADKAAREWLALIDGGDYSASWENAAAIIKAVVTKEGWDKQMSTFRKPLGEVVSRKLKSQQYTTELPGVPDGEYVIIQYESSFQNKKEAIETVTPMKEEDGTWRVSGYYIK